MKRKREEEGMSVGASDGDSNKKGKVLTEEEAALYDRQIRLWGVDAQQRMGSSKILICGFNGIHAEVAKNLVLAGVGAVTVLDDVKHNPQGLSAQFFLTENGYGEDRGQLGIEKVKELNPKVKITFESGNVKNKDEGYITQFDIVLISGADFDTMIKIDNITRTHNIPLFTSESFGYFSFMFNDLNGFQYTPPAPKENKDSKPQQDDKSQGKEEEESKEDKQNPKRQKLETTNNQPQKVTVHSSSLQQIWNKSWNGKEMDEVHEAFYAITVFYEWQKRNGNKAYVEGQNEEAQLLRIKDELFKSKRGGKSSRNNELLLRIGRSAKADLSPICAIVGGVIGQEVIKVLSAQDEPLQNFFFCDGYHGISGVVQDISAEVRSAPVQQAVVVELDD